MPDSNLLQKLAEAENEIAALREQVKRLREALRTISVAMDRPFLRSWIKQTAAEAYAFEK